MIKGNGLLNIEVPRAINKIIDEALERMEMYKEHASPLLIKAYLNKYAYNSIHNLYRKLEKNNRKVDMNMITNEVYQVGCSLFESILEYGCKSGGNGHHMGQWLSSEFEKEFNYDRSKERNIK